MKNNKQSGIVRSSLKEDGFTLIEILVVIGMVAILATIVLIAINPARQFAQGRNTQRSSNINAILNAIGQYTADSKGILPAGIPVAPTAPAFITNTGGVDLCPILMPTYIASLPSDPNQSGPFTSCTAYDTGYSVQQDTTGRVTVFAPSAELGVTLKVTR